MEHAKKMVVVPQELIERMREGEPTPPVGRGSGGGLDAEMHRILNDKRLDDNEKWKQYQQILQRFLHASAAKRRGISIPIVHEPGEGVVGEEEEGGRRRVGPRPTRVRRPDRRARRHVSQDLQDGGPQPVEVHEPRPRHLGRARDGTSER